MATNLGAPSRYFETVVPHASNNFTMGECSYLYVGVAGNVTAICNGTPQLFSNLAVGWHPIMCTRVNAVGTSATDMVAARSAG
jgi:hypothetical protein